MLSSRVNIPKNYNKNRVNIKETKTVCDALNNVTDEQWDKQCKKTDTLLAWKNWMTGAMAALGLVMTIGIFVVNRSFERADKGKIEMVSTTKELAKAITALDKSLSVFRQEVQPFITAGPRFTKHDYEVLSKAQLAEVKEWVREELQQYPPQWLQDQVKSIDRRVELLEQHNSPTE